MSTFTLRYALALSSLLTLGQELGYLKASHAFDHYATLPISRVQMVLALVTKGMLFSLPSRYSLSGTGAMIGFYCRTHAQPT